MNTSDLLWYGIYTDISGYYLEFIYMQSVLEKVKNFFTPSYWLSGAEDDRDAAESGMTIEGNAVLMSSHQHSRTDSSSRHQRSSGEQQALASSSTAWKKNLIVLNEDTETGPSWAFQNDADTVLRPSTDSGGTQSSSQSSNNSLQHNTKLFIPTTSVSTPQHSSTPMKKQGSDDNLEVSPVQVEGDVTRKVATVQSSSDQQEHATTRVEEKLSTSSTIRLHQHGSMLTPPGQFTVVICAIISVLVYATGSLISCNQILLFCF